MPIWEAILLGVVQGLTEFLPISSTAHLLVVRTLLGHAHPEDAFTVVIQLGTLVAVFAYFRADVARLLAGLWADIRTRRIASTPDSRLAWLITLGTVPAVIVGFLFKRQLKETFFNLQSIAVVSIAFALLMFAAEWWAKRRAKHGLAEREETEIGWLDALWVGVWQACALMPGGSRSGTTISGGSSRGSRTCGRAVLVLALAAGDSRCWAEGTVRRAQEARDTAARASRQSLRVWRSGRGARRRHLVSAVVGYLSIAFLLNFLKRYSMGVFVVYRLLMGAGILALLGAAVLK